MGKNKKKGGGSPSASPKAASSKPAPAAAAPAAASTSKAPADGALTTMVPPPTSSQALPRGMAQYKEMYDMSLQNPDKFWGDLARENITWMRPFTGVSQGSFEYGDIAWFTGGSLNLSVNCLDRHLDTKANDIAIIHEGDEPGDSKSFTYREVFHEVCKLTNALRGQGIRKGDCVTIYMPMVPEAAFTMLACARIGAPHSVVFAGFSAEALRDRIVDCNSHYVITADEGKRGGKTIPLKKTVDDSIRLCPDPDIVEKVVVLKRTGAEVSFNAERDVWYHEIVEKERPFAVAEEMESEDTLFYLYTSGSTGRPKGIAHSQAGYLLYTMVTQKYVFDLRPGDVYACVADVGWITGHSYIVYGPLANGCTTVMFESVPTYPDCSRYWDMVERHKINIFYTAPTAIRALMKFGEDPVRKHDKSSLRVLGTVGEPINPEAWRWYFEVVGEKRCSVCDTYWQTETGGHMLTPLAGVTPMLPGAATLPFFGVEPVLVDAQSGAVVEGNDVSGVLCMARPWPSIARTVFGDHNRYLNTYMNAYKGYYFTGDGCIRDKNGYYMISGRVDDVINNSGHRIGSAEVESALVANPKVAEAAVVGCPHDVKGQGIFCYVILKNGVEENDDLLVELKLAVRAGVGAFATPDFIVPTPALPKTRSGKIMRRILRKIAANETDSLGDISTLADPSVVDKLIAKVRPMLEKK